MAKPVLVIDVPIISNDNYKGVRENIINATSEEYHVLVRMVPDDKNLQVQCFNDCKGLLDADIEKMIKELICSYQQLPDSLPPITP